MKGWFGRWRSGPLRCVGARGCNPLAGEVLVTIDGTARRAKLTLGALAEMEEVLPDRSLPALVSRLEGGDFSARDIMAVLVAGLRGGGWDIDAAALARAEIAGGPVAAAEAAGRMLALAFAPLGAREGQADG